MCSCFHSITCCWDAPESSKQEEVAENERNQPYIISPAAGYVNAAFEDAATTPVVSQPQHCDITIEAPPRECTLLGSAPPLTAAIPGSSQSVDADHPITPDHSLTIKAEPSTSQSLDYDGQANICKALTQKPQENQESDNEDETINSAFRSDENDDIHSRPSINNCAEYLQDQETVHHENEADEGLCNQEGSKPFHWLPVCSTTESQVSEVESEALDQMESDCDETSLELIHPGSKNFNIPTIQHSHDISIDCQDLPVPPVPNTSMLSNEFDESSNVFTALSTVDETSGEVTASAVANVDAKIPSINCAEELSLSSISHPEEGPENSSGQESGFVSLITILHDEEDSVQYHTLRPQTGLSLESMDSAISMGSSPQHPDVFDLSRSYSCNLQLTNSSEALSDSCDYIEEPFELVGVGQRPRFVSLTSVSTSLTDLDNEEMSVITSRNIIVPSDDQSDGEVDVSDGEVSISKEVNVTTLNKSDTPVTIHTSAKNDRNPVYGKQRNQSWTNETQYLEYESDNELSQIGVTPLAECDECSLQNDADKPLFEPENETLQEVQESYVNKLDSSIQDTSLDDDMGDSSSANIEESPAEYIANLFTEKEPSHETCENVSMDISSNEVQLVNTDHCSPPHLKELAIQKLVEIVYTASHVGTANPDSDIQHIMTSDVTLKDKIRTMLMLQLNELKPNNDLPDILTKVVDEEYRKNDARTLMDRKSPVDDLESALRSGDRSDIEITLQKLLKLGYAIELSHPRKDSYCMISIAAQHGHVFFFKMLKDNGIDFEVIDTYGYYPIHYAVMSGDSDLVDFFAEQGHLNLLTQKKDSALHLAVGEGDLRLSRQLVETAKQSSTSLDIANQEGMTPLHLAVLAGHVDIVRCLIYHGFNVNSTTSQGLSLLMLAAHKEQFEIAEILLSNCASPLTEDAKGNNVLHFFVSSKSYLMLDVILAHYYPKDAIDNQNFDGQSALHTAAMNGDEVAILSLLNNGANIDLPDQDGRTALLLCATGCRTSLLTTLVTLGSDIHHQDNHGNNILHYIAKTGNGTMTDFLLHQCQVNPNTQNNSGQTALHIAAQCAHSDVIAVMLTSSVKLDVPDTAGRMPLHEACRQGNLTIVAQLVYSGAKMDPRDEDNLTPVVIAGLRRAVDVVQYLISKDNDSESLYDLAKFALADDIIFLKNYNVDFDKQDRNGNTALHHAILNRNEHVAKLLLEAGVSASLFDNQSNSVLHLACASSSVEMVDLLIRSSCLIDSHNKQGETPAYIAAVEKRYHILTLLVRHGANLNTKLRDGRTLVFVAVENNDAELTQLLMSHGADVNYVCSGTMTRPIHVAAKLGHKSVMTLLLKVLTEVDIAEFFSRKTPLHFAAEGGWKEVVLQLLAVGADVNLETGCGEKALHLAAREGHDHVVEALLQAGTQLSLLDEDGCPRYDLSKHRHVWAVIKVWALQHPSTVNSHRRLPAALASLRSVIREAFRASRSHHSALDAAPPYS